MKLKIWGPAEETEISRKLREFSEATLVALAKVRQEEEAARADRRAREANGVHIKCRICGSPNYFYEGDGQYGRCGGCGNQLLKGR